MSVASSDSNHEGEEEKDFDEEENLDEENEPNIEEVEEDVDVGMEREFSIVAIPPKVVPYEENQLEVSSSPAFHILDAVSIFHSIPFI